LPAIERLDHAAAVMTAAHDLRLHDPGGRALRDRPPELRPEVRSTLLL